MAKNKKGPEFEREVCRALSAWVSGGARRDLFWRSAMSGGRATRFGGEGFVAQEGDICAVDSEGFPLARHFVFELKFYADLDWDKLVYGRVTCMVAKAWEKTCDIAVRLHKEPMLILKQNLKPPVVCLSPLGAELLCVPRFCGPATAEFNLPGLEAMRVWKLADLLSIEYSKIKGDLCES